MIVVSYVSYFSGRMGMQKIATHHFEVFQKADVALPLVPHSLQNICRSSRRLQLRKMLGGKTMHGNKTQMKKCKYHEYSDNCYCYSISHICMVFLTA